MTETTRKPLSGLDSLRAMLAGKGRAPAISATLNFKAVAVEEGVVTFTGTPLEAFTNPIGTVHGGWYGAILDSCMACAVFSKLPAGTGYTTLEYKVNIIRPIPLGTEVTATGTAQHVGRSTGVAVGEIRGVDGRLYATGSTTCIVMSQG
ncbi:PaaI family thioesterase [Pseudooceanicola spongiae]|jgi:uncharacterized protein (TIGR00369 family)|uniref:Hotdog fold thioesterase n=1 Tax=Pseudooceanicola spongiae TaxID=2613965 RepID=A0A7L9WLR1_9RHOB|nr:PaaI family thioesterase [Pseudooceanicola spongiae]QOL80863.1 hotdog fold thioesterase [Pseudooceanicola spongiae]